MIKSWPVNSKYKNMTPVHKDKIHMSPDWIKQLIRRYVTASNGVTKVGGYDIQLQLSNLPLLSWPISLTDEIGITRWGVDQRVPLSEIINFFDKWYFVDEAALLVAYPNGIANPTDRDGWFVRLWSTDTVRIRDSNTNAWVDSGASWPVIPTHVENEPVVVSATNTLDPLANTPIAWSVRLYVNWVTYHEWDSFTIAWSTITRTFLPPSGFDLETTDNVFASYQY